MSKSPYLLNTRMLEVRWSGGSCGQSGCTDPECVCALCAKPIGISDQDPRKANHDPECFGCDLCVDDVPIILFRGEGKDSGQAAFHDHCFKTLLLNPANDAR
jgi:hypothetical protein